jgi:Cytochrome P450
MQRAAARYEQGSPHHDLFHYLVNPNTSPRPLPSPTLMKLQIDESGVQSEPPTKAEVLSDSLLAIVAGSDTIATTLSNLFCFLLANPSTYTRLQAEVDTLGTEDLHDHALLEQMPYLNAVMFVPSHTSASFYLSIPAETKPFVYSLPSSVAANALSKQRTSDSSSDHSKSPCHPQIPIRPDIHVLCKLHPTGHQCFHPFLLPPP